MSESNRNLQSLNQDSFGVTYADPLDPDFSVRFKNTRANKNLNGVNTQNYVTEIICNDNAPVVLNGVNATDALSVRVRVSGSFEATDRKIQILKSLGEQLSAWADENVLVGFTPTTVPYNTVTDA
jgi:hypothetical protein